MLIYYASQMCISDVFSDLILTGTPQMCDTIALYSWEHTSVKWMSNGRTDRLPSQWTKKLKNFGVFTLETMDSKSNCYKL